MAEKTIEEVSKKIKTLYEKANVAIERNNLDYAVDLLLKVLSEEPGFVDARKRLRKVEIKRNQGKKKGLFGKAFSGASFSPKYMKAQKLIKNGKNEEAMQLIEELLKDNPLDVNYLTLLSNAAVGCSYPETAIHALETARSADPNNLSILNTLANLFVSLGRMSSAKECLEKVCELAPNDPDALKALKDVLAKDSIKEGKWDEDTSYKDKLKDAEEAKILEKQSKAVKTEDDINVLIEENLKLLEKEPGNINYMRKLARFYLQKNMFAEAAEMLQKAQALTPGDPEIDDALTNVYAKYYDYEIESLTKAGKIEEAQAKEAEKAQFLFDDMQQRIERYPNDLNLKYEWGVMLFDADYIQEAIEQLQVAQRSPKYRTQALYYLAMCFRKKGQLDLAIEQLKKAEKELYGMDDSKKDILYQLASINEEMGNKEEALSYYKQIYSVDIKYKDVAQKVESGYRS